LRRLVYLISSSYLLQKAIDCFIIFGYTEKANLTPTPLSNLTKHFILDRHIRVLRFLATHNFIIFDDTAQTLALTPTLGVGLARYINLSQIERDKVRKTCAITLNNNSLQFEGSPTAVVAALYHMGKFSKHLHSTAKYNLTAHIADNTREKCSFIANKKINKVDELYEYLLHYQFITCNNDGVYSLTKLGAYLNSEHPDTLQPALAMINSAWWKAVDAFLEPFVSPMGIYYSTPFEIANNQTFFHYLGTNPKKQARFNRGLACLTKNTIRAIVSQLQSLPVFDLKNFRSIIDIAGGAGGLFTEIQKLYPDLHQLTLFDQEAVINDILSNAVSKPSSWKFIKGDFFKPSPENGIPQDNDLYIIKGTLHDFDDATCLRILSHVRENIPAHSSLYLIERTLPDTNKPHINYYGDLMMMMLLGGRGRRPHEWSRLLSLTGFNWLNAHNPLEAEDHTIMICRPSNIEISRGIRLFDHKKPLHIQPFDHNTDYSPDTLLMLLQAINPNEDVNAMLHPMALNDVVNLDLGTYAQNYLFLALQHKQNWCGMIIDRFSQQTLYFDPCGNPLPEQLHNFLGLTVHTLQRKLCASSQNSGALLLALFVSALHKFELLETPTYTHEHTLQWLEYVHNSVHAETTDEIDALRTQQQRWADNFREESTEQPGFKGN
nr:hypothetical protein [Pseudomonadota bacterium]